MWPCVFITTADYKKGGNSDDGLPVGEK